MLSQNQSDGLTVADLERLRIPDGPYARAWLEKTNALLAWRQRQQASNARETYFTSHFFKFWFKSQHWQGRILDVGGAGGGMIKEITTQSKTTAYWTVDPLLREEQRDGTKDVRTPGVGEAMPFVPDNWANVVTSFSTMQHCIDPVQMCKEVHRVVRKDDVRGKPCGRFFGSVCLGESSEMVVHGLSENDIDTIFYTAGFKLTRSDLFKGYLFCWEAVPV